MILQAKYIKRIAIRSILFLQMTGFFYENLAHAWSYPVKEVAKPSCKLEHRSKLSPECKMALPIIARANYESYRENQMYRLIYSVLRGAPYSDWWNMTKWAHEWIDIVSAEWTPVYAVEDWVIFRARSVPGYGNLVTVKHTLANGKVVYSINGHLETITVKEWDKVTEWQQIWTIWHEWMARWNHLHFAINTTPDNTYVFSWCPEYPKVWDYQVWEQGLCRENLFARTVDPIAFIEYDGLIPTTLTTTRIINKNIVKRTNTWRKIVPVGPIITQPVKVVTNTTPTKPVTNPTVTATKPTISVTSTSSSTDAFLQKWTITATPNFGSTLKNWSSSSIAINVTSKDGKKFTGILDKEISLTPTKNIVSLSPRVIRNISQGQIVTIIEAKSTGTTELVLSYWDTVIGKINVTVN